MPSDGHEDFVPSDIEAKLCFKARFVTVAFERIPSVFTNTDVKLRSVWELEMSDFPLNASSLSS